MGKYTDRLDEYVNTHAVSIVSANPINGGSNLQHPSTDTVNTDTVVHAVSDVSNTIPHAVSIDGVSSTPRVDTLKAADELKLRRWGRAIFGATGDPTILIAASGVTTVKGFTAAGKAKAAVKPFQHIIAVNPRLVDATSGLGSDVVLKTVN